MTMSGGIIQAAGATGAGADARVWRIRGGELRLTGRTLVMGILNVTPDSFSDGGRFVGVEAALRGAEAMVAAGADLIDVGGESTRPGATPVSEEEELRRVLPVVEGLAGRVGVPVSIDTQKPGVAWAAVAAGAAIVNDVAANREDQAMWREVAASGAGYVCMHMRGNPQTMQESPSYGDVVEEVDAFLGERLVRLGEAGVGAEQVVLDVGIGFGKTVEHNLKLLAALERFKKWRRPLLLGVSRKSFLSALLGGGVEDRLPGSLACACWAVRAGVEILRVHDVPETVRAVRLTEALLARHQ